MGKRILGIILASCVALTLMGALSGCGGTGAGGEASPGDASLQEEAGLGAVELEWNGYTMGIDLVTEDEEMSTVGNVQVEGRLVKVCFYYIGDAQNNGGFPGDIMLDELQTHPITLTDADGTVYKWTGAMGDVAFTGTNLSDENFGIAEIQERFSITFDVPEDVALEDLTLDVGDGQKIQLSEYISDAYQADLND